MSLQSRIKKKLKFMLSTTHRVGKVMTFKDYCKAYNKAGDYRLIDSYRKTLVMPVQFVGDEKVSSYECFLPDTYYVSLADGCIIGGSSVVISKEGVILYDMLSKRKEYQANMTDNGLFLLGGKPRHISEYYVYNYYGKKDASLNKGISLACNMSNNYYHFMLEVAARFYLLEKTEIPSDIPLIVDEVVLNIPQMKEIIDALNTDNREIITIKQNHRMKVKRLYVISEPNVIIPNSSIKGESRTENFAFDKYAIDFLKHRLSSLLTTGKTDTPKRIFLSRKNCNKRQCNEEELLPILKNYGFKVVYTEDLSVADQIQLFSNAEHIIGSSGAAFTNLIFCDEGTIATLFFTVKINATCFSSLGSVQDVKTFHMAASEGGNDIHVGKFSISKDALLLHLESFYN